jgi:hypothetical protein
MLTDNGKLDYTDAYGTIYHVEWEKINDGYQVITRTDTPFVYGRRAKHKASGQSPFITIFCLGTRLEQVQLLKIGADQPVQESVIDSKFIYLPVSPNGINLARPFKFDLGCGTMPTDPTSYYCIDGPHFTNVEAIEGEMVTIWPAINNDGSVVADDANLVFINVWDN